MTPQVGDKVNLQGAVGTITKVTPDTVIVEGAYYYPLDGLREPFLFCIEKEDLLKSTQVEIKTLNTKFTWFDTLRKKKGD